ncbi:metallophosphoesterase family protein [Spirochaeta africana]|uniref:Uncharacterized protein n=1 Tax=Spirochaeta africana (strain ATCC 700263 / DSM 8902 / Z-7692) TaxID=889378 RepID=H9UL92_SPIAZ|nr:metallophosphoesterase family protein [Spirochaeta africana]AFG38285.1 hypothetical protein Spiaf_2249 [Spirochaeta africana DSM 8902]
MDDFILNHMADLLHRTPLERFPDDRPMVIISDFHAGDGGRRDDFKHNGQLTLAVLEEYYRRGCRLLLNGDVEELQKVRLEKIQRAWGDLYQLLERFDAEGRLIRLAGNHDLELLYNNPLPTPVREAVRYQFSDSTTGQHLGQMFIFHGHQASRRYAMYNDLIGWLLRHLVHRLPFHYTSVSHDNRKKKRMESRVYEMAARERVVAVIGHTHRPLFESLSKSDFVKYNIERLCRQYTDAAAEEREAIRLEIGDLRAHLEAVSRSDMVDLGSIYHDSFVVPCMFNSGCVLGKRGITCLELTGSHIALKYWFDGSRSRKYLLYDGYDTVQLPGTGYYETEIKSEQLRYIFSRIDLLT